MEANEQVNPEEAFRYAKARMQEFAPSLSPELLEELSLGWRVMHFKKGDTLLRAGTKQAEAFLIVCGMVRAYYPAVEEDVTINFVAEGDFATHYSSLERPQPSRFTFDALEPTTVVAIAYPYVLELSQRQPEVERLVRLLLEYEYARLMAHTESLLIRNAEERYRLFLQRFGHLMARISVTDLASYLGVSRQSLTLIRRRLLKG